MAADIDQEGWFDVEGSIPEGTVVGGRWRIIGYLGAGGFGEVLLAEDASAVGLGRAALKVLHPNTTPQERQQFLSEVKKIAVLRHQNLVGYLDSGQVAFDGNGLPDLGGEIRPYLVTELCEKSLDDHVGAAPGGALGVGETFAVLADVATGLAHLHERDLIHRDIKTGNVLLADGRWKLADFGLMRDLSATGSYHRGDQLIGTPLYMAPELFTTMTATAPSDVYALGVLAHVCATGRPLHTGSGPALLHNVATVAPTIAPDLDPGLADLVRACTQAAPEHRPTALRLAETLRSGGSVGAPPTLAIPPQQGRPPAAPPMPRPTGAPAPAPPMPRPTGAPAPAGPIPGPAGASAPTPPMPGPTGPPGAEPPTVAAAGFGAPPSPPRPRGSGVPRAALIGALVGVAALVLGAAGFVLMRGDGDEAADRGAPATAAPADAPATTTRDGGADADPATTQGPDDGATAPSEPDPGPGATGPLTDVESHFDTQPCASGPVNQVPITNRHDGPVDYQLLIHHFDDAGVRIAESFDTVRALPAGQRALLGMKSPEEGAVSCQIESFSASPTDPAVVEAIDEAMIVSCILDEFFGNWYDITYYVGNPQDQTIIADTAFGIIDADGVRIDESFTNTIYGIDPGERVQQETSEVFWNMDEVEQEPVECIVTWVELAPDPTS